MSLIFLISRVVLLLAISSCSRAYLTIITQGSISGDVPVHRGWSDVRAIGAKSPAAQNSATGIAPAPSSLFFSWNPMTSARPIDSYNVYRATASGAQDFTNPLATGVLVTNFTDHSAVAGTTYYYVVRPVIEGVALSTSESFSEIKIFAPPQNMALVHRWIVNQEICGLMNRTPDPENNYRCAYGGPGNIGGYYDLEKSLLVDQFELGCNYTPPPGCGDAVNGCVGLTPPGPTDGNVGDVHYDRGASSGHCRIKVDATTWKEARDTSLTTLEALSISSHHPGLPPLVRINQAAAWHLCVNRTVSGVPGNMRLMSRKEHLAASAWEPTYSDAVISMIEDGINLPATGHCNSNYASGLTRDDNVTPTDLETFPGILSGGADTVRTGSNSTRNCVSRYGLQDMVANAMELVSDNLESCTSATDVCVGGVSLVDPDNTDLLGYEFNGVIGPGGGGININSWELGDLSHSATRIAIPMGLPFVTSADSSWDHLAIGVGSGEFHPDKFHDDEIILYTSSSNGNPRQVTSGGKPTTSGNSGRFAVSFQLPPTTTTFIQGTRCAIALD